MEELNKNLTPSLVTSTTVASNDLERVKDGEKEKEEESPQLAADDLFEIQEFLGKKSWIEEKIRVRNRLLLPYQKADSSCLVVLAV